LTWGQKEGRDSATQLSNPAGGRTILTRSVEGAGQSERLRIKEGGPTSRHCVTEKKREGIKERVGEDLTGKRGKEGNQVRKSLQ